MKAIVITANPTANHIKFGQPPYLVQIIDDANAQELQGDFLFIYKRICGFALEDRAAFRSADVIKVIFEE